MTRMRLLVQQERGAKEAERELGLGLGLDLHCCICQSLKLLKAGSHLVNIDYGGAPIDNAQCTAHE